MPCEWGETSKYPGGPQYEPAATSDSVVLRDRRTPSPGRRTDHRRLYSPWL